MFARKHEKVNIMARQSKTSITEDKAKKHYDNAPFRAELACTKITGFHLQKNKTGATWRFRYRVDDIQSADSKKKKTRLINLGKYENGTKDRIAAAELASTYRGQVDEGRDPAAEAQRDLEQKKAKHIHDKTSTVGAYLEGDYTEHQKDKRNEGKPTINIIKSNFKDWLEIPMSEITHSMLKDWQAAKKRENKSHDTIKRAFGALRTMLRYAVQEKVLESDPIADFKLRAPSSTEQDKKHDGSELQKRRMLTSDELAKLNVGISTFKAECESKEMQADRKNPVPNWFYYFYRLAAYSGLRPGDLYSLNWFELNINFKKIVKTPMKTRHHNDPVTVEIGLDDEMYSLMKEWHERSGKPTAGLVFSNPETGKPYDRQAHDKHWKRVLKLGGVKEAIDFYSLRHHFISKMVSSGVDVFTVARLAGHRDLKMIQKHYGHLAPDSSARAIAMVASDFSSKAYKEGAA